MLTSLDIQALSTSKQWAFSSCKLFCSVGWRKALPNLSFIKSKQPKGNSSSGCCWTKCHCHVSLEFSPYRWADRVEWNMRSTSGAVYSHYFLSCTHRQELPDRPSINLVIAMLKTNTNPSSCWMKETLEPKFKKNVIDCLWFINPLIKVNVQSPKPVWV